MSEHIPKESLRAIEHARRLQTSRDTHQGSLIASLGFETKKEREAMEVTHDTSFERMNHAADALRQAEVSTVHEGADDATKRLGRDEAVDALYDSVRRVKESLAQGDGARMLSQYGLRGRTPRSPKALLDQASTMMAMLGQDGLAIHGALGEPLDLGRRAEMLRGPIGDLRAALDHVEQEEGELNALIIERDTWRARLARTTKACEALYEALFLLADQEALWERERSSIEG